jgi:hypothetical protein
MPDFIVCHVRKDLTYLWRQHWSKTGPTEESKKADKDGSLSQSTPISAKTKEEAETKIKMMFPGDVVMSVETMRTR